VQRLSNGGVDVAAIHSAQQTPTSRVASNGSVDSHHDAGSDAVAMLEVDETTLFDALDILAEATAVLEGSAVVDAAMSEHSVIAIEEHLTMSGRVVADAQSLQRDIYAEIRAEVHDMAEHYTLKCPECTASLARQEGCVKCHDCGWAAC
jgi:hypothetical protein